MQSIVHFLLSIVAGLAIAPHIENRTKKYSLIFLLALATTSIDLDHFLPFYQETGIKIFHNVFVFVVFPIALFLAFCLYERKKGSSIMQRVSLLLCIMFVGHMFLDAISAGGLPLFYPLSSFKFTIGEMAVASDSPVFSLTSAQVLMLIWGAMIFGANIAETLIYNDVEGHGSYDSWLKSPWKYIKSKKTHLPSFNSGMLSLKPRFTQVIGASDAFRQESEDLEPNDVADYIFDFVNNLPDQGDQYYRL